MVTVSEKEIKVAALNDIIRACEARKAADRQGYRVKTGIALVDDLPLRVPGAEHQLIELLKERLLELPSDPSEEDYGPNQEIREKVEEMLSNLRTVAATTQGRAVLDSKLQDLRKIVQEG